MVVYARCEGKRFFIFTKFKVRDKALGAAKASKLYGKARYEMYLKVGLCRLNSRSNIVVRNGSCKEIEAQCSVITSS